MRAGKSRVRGSLTERGGKALVRYTEPEGGRRRAVTIESVPEARRVFDELQENPDAAAGARRKKARTERAASKDDAKTKAQVTRAHFLLQIGEHTHFERRWVTGEEAKLFDRPMVVRGQDWLDAEAADPGAHYRRMARLGGVIRDRDKRAFAELENAELHSKFDDCGWWWCGRFTGPEPSLTAKRWKGLSLAVRALKKHGIDPHGKEVAEVASIFTDIESLEHEKTIYESMQQSVRRALSELPGDLAFSAAMGDMDLLRAMNAAIDALKVVTTRLEHWQARTKRLKPDAVAGGTENWGQRRTIEAAKALGWKKADVTAALVLTGVLRDDYRQVSKRIDDMWKKVSSQPGTT